MIYLVDNTIDGQGVSPREIRAALELLRPDESILMEHYKDVSLARVNELAPSHIILSGQSNPWTDYTPDDLAGVFEVILPKENEKDLAEVPENLRNAMKLNFVDTMDQVLQIALEKPLPQAQGEEEVARPRDRDGEAQSHPCQAAQNSPQDNVLNGRRQDSKGQTDERPGQAEAQGPGGGPEDE